MNYSQGKNFGLNLFFVRTCTHHPRASEKELEKTKVTGSITYIWQVVCYCNDHQGVIYFLGLHQMKSVHDGTLTWFTAMRMVRVHVLLVAFHTDVWDVTDAILISTFFSSIFPVGRFWQPSLHWETLFCWFKFLFGFTGKFLKMYIEPHCGPQKLLAFPENIPSIKVDDNCQENCDKNCGGGGRISYSN